MNEEEKKYQMLNDFAKEIGDEGWDYCMAFLSCGKKYNATLLESLVNNEEFKKIKCAIFVATDDPDYFSQQNVRDIYLRKIDPVFLNDVRPDRDKKWFNFNLKRKAIKFAFDFGYRKILYMDSDIILKKWDKDFLIKEQKGFWFRTFLSREQPAHKFKYYNKLYHTDLWHYYRPVSEKIIYINESADKIGGFLKTWQRLDHLARNKVNPYTEGHEILISLRFNGCSVNKYNPDPFKDRPEKMMEDLKLR